MSAHVSYVLPIRWTDDAGLDELTAYLRWLAARAELVVVDGSPPALFDRHRARWSSFALHVPPDPDLRFLNGKVNGVHTGLRRASSEAVVIADDDVRYDERALARLVALLDEHDLVRPQNHFDPVPWHAMWDGARSLLNRAFGRDWPGTFGVRRSTFERMHGYDGDVLFENLELVRTVEAAGGRVAAPLDLYVRRLPPSTRTFWSQRPRQAYDEWARPWLLALWLSVVPLVAILAVTSRWPVLLVLALAVVALAERGRRRAGGARVFPFRAALFAPLWVLERGICSWLALWMRARGGVAYGGRALRRAASPRRLVRQRLGV